MPRRTESRPDTVDLTRTLLGRSVVACALALLVACAPRVDAGVAPPVGANPRPSPGCAAPAAPRASLRVLVAGQERGVVLRIPAGRRGVPRDLVIAFHGRTNDAEQVRRYTRLDDALPSAVIAYPRALRSGPGTFSWSAAGDPPDRLRDFALVEAIIDVVGRDACIDLARVFVVGHSLGASFANDVACRLGDRIRAVGSVAGGVQGGACAGRVAAIVLHHPDDPLVPFAEGTRVRDTFLAANGQADTTPEPAPHASLAALRCVRYADDAGTHPVVWCPHDDARAPGGRHDPHTWPTGVAAAIATFFESLP